TAWAAAICRVGEVLGSVSLSRGSSARSATKAVRIECRSETTPSGQACRCPAPGSRGKRRGRNRESRRSFPSEIRAPFVWCVRLGYRTPRCAFRLKYACQPLAKPDRVVVSAQNRAAFRPNDIQHLVQARTWSTWGHTHLP